MINDNDSQTSGSLSTQEEAVSIATRLIAAGHSVDLGLMQINSRNLSALGLSIVDSFDACHSLAAGARVLSDGYAGGDTHNQQQVALRQAISRYNTGNPVSGFRNGYVHKVELAARFIPALDVGPVDTANAMPVEAKSPAPQGQPVDPNAPPPWDVWTSFDYAAAHEDAQGAAKKRSDTTAVVITDEGNGSPSAVPAPGPTQTRSHDIFTP